MISLYSGTPGSGKSLHVASIIATRCHFQRITICNFDINRDAVKNGEFCVYVDNEDLSPDWLVEFSQDYFSETKFKEGALLLVLDEAQLLFNVREWNLKGRERWVHFFTQHRKFGYDVIMIAQFDRMIDKQIRSLFEYEVKHRKMSNFGWKGKAISIWSGNRMFIAVKFWYPLKERIGSERFYYKKSLGELYDTLGIFAKPDNDKKKEIPDKKNIDDYDDIIEFEEII